MLTQEPRRETEAEIRTTCSNCGADLFAHPCDAGKRATCPECGSSLLIPPADNAAAATSPPPRFRLKDAPGPDREAADLPPPGETPEQAPAPSASMPAVSQRHHEARANLTGWLRRVVIVVLAFVAVEVFQATCAETSLLAILPADLHGIAETAREFAASVPDTLHLAFQERPAATGMLTPFERVCFGILMLLLIARLVVRTKLLDAIYVTTERWMERTDVGLVISFFALLLQAGVLAWTASTVRNPEASDGLACGLLGLSLMISAGWLLTLRLVAGAEYPELSTWMFTDGVFSLGIFLVLLWPDAAPFWTRAGATLVLGLANSALALHVGASFIFHRRPPGWWWRKPLFVIISFSFVLLGALILACAR